MSNLKKILGFAMLLMLPLLGEAQRPGKYCHPADQTKDLSEACFCLNYHPDLCEDENGPLPSCCKATEKDSKMRGCLCCAGKKAASVEERGMFIHQRVVEYAQ